MGALDPKNRRNLALRVASAIVLFPLAVWLTFVGGRPFALLAAVAAAVAAAELILMFGTIGLGELFGIGVAAAIPLMAAFGQSGDLLPGWSGLALAAATVILLGTFLFRQRPLEEIPRAVATVTLSWMYCGLLIAALVALRLRFGVAWVILAFVVTWANDTFAYFAGRAFGGRFTQSRLAPVISPKKSWEGVWGGMAGVVVLAVAWVLADQAAAAPSPSLHSRLAVLGWWAVVLGAVFLAAMSVIGDLTESLVKRAAGFKDSSGLLPGHGGVLDRVDALLPTLPLAMMLATLATLSSR